MICPNCQCDIAEDSNFCSKCGHKLEFTCSEYGNINSPDSSFCSKYGHQLTTTHSPTLAPAVEFSFEEKLDNIQRYQLGGPTEKILAQRGKMEGERKMKLQKLTGLYVILDTAFIKDGFEMDIANQAIEGGARIIQLRDKMRGHGALLSIALLLQELCTKKGALFIVNDYLDIALASNADGLHLGKLDLPLSIARQLLPTDKLLGSSSYNLTQAIRAQEDGADYVAVRTYYRASYKSNSKIVGWSLVPNPVSIRVTLVKRSLT